MSLSVFGQFFEDQPAVKPEIDFEIKYDNGYILFKFYLKKDFHITDLKNDFFKITIERNEFLEVRGITFPEGIRYGDEMVFKNNFDVFVYVKNLKKIPADGKEFKFNIAYQICQEKPVEVCFPPEEDELSLKLNSDFINVADIKTKENTEKKSFAGWVEHTIKEELEKKSLFLFLLVFLGGFLTSFTPCVYPVIPIVMGYVGTRSGKSKFKGFYLSVFFVLGLAIVYSVFGVIAAMTGSMMGISFQNPLVVIIIAAIFIIMGLSLAGFFEIPVPSSISSKVRKGHKSEIIGSLIVGGVAGIIAAPCVGPVLIALLSWISQTGNVFLGFWLTFTFSLGLGVIFLLAGTFSGAISAMPKGGKWMDYFKYFFAVLLIGGGLYFLNSVLSEWMNLVLWGVFLISASVFSGLFKPSEDGELKGKVFRVILIIIFLTGSMLFVRGINSKYFPTSSQVIPEVQKKDMLKWESDLEKGKSAAKSKGKILMIDTYADWCVACKELDEKTFSDDMVREELNNFILVKLDFTEKNNRNEQIRKKLNVIGMPTVIFLDNNGKEINRFSGFLKKEKFLKFLNDNIKPEK